MQVRYWLAWVIVATPGLIAGGVVGWLIIRPVNLVLGILFAASTGCSTWRRASTALMVGWMLQAEFVWS